MDVASYVLTGAAVVAVLVAAAGGIGQVRGGRDKATIAAQKEFIDILKIREVERDKDIAELKAGMALMRSSWVTQVGHDIAVEVGREVAGAVNVAIVPFLDSLASRVETLEGRGSAAQQERRFER